MISLFLLAAVASPGAASPADPCASPSLGSLAFTTVPDGTVAQEGVPAVLDVASPPIPPAMDWTDTAGCVLQIANSLGEPIDFTISPSGDAPGAKGSLPYGAGRDWSLSRVNGAPLGPGKIFYPLFYPGDKVAYLPAGNDTLIEIKGTYTGKSVNLAIGGKNIALGPGAEKVPVCVVTVESDEASPVGVGDPLPARVKVEAMPRAKQIALTPYLVTHLGGLAGMPVFSPASEHTLYTVDAADVMLTSVVLTGTPRVSLVWQLGGDSGHPDVRLPACDPLPEAPVVHGAEGPLPLVELGGGHHDAGFPDTPQTLPVEPNGMRRNNELSYYNDADGAGPVLGPCRTIPVYGRFVSNATYGCGISRIDGSGTWVYSDTATPIANSLLLCSFRCDQTLFGTGKFRLSGVMRVANDTTTWPTFVGAIPLKERFGSGDEIMMDWENHPGGPANRYDRGNLSINANVRVQGGPKAGSGCLLEGAPHPTAGTILPGEHESLLTWGASSDASYVFVANTGVQGEESTCPKRRTITARALEPRAPGPSTVSSSSGGAEGTTLARAEVEAGAASPWFAPTRLAVGHVARVAVVTAGNSSISNITPGANMSFATEPSCLNFQGRPAIFCGVFTDCIRPSPTDPGYAPSAARVTTAFTFGGGASKRVPMPPVTCEARSSAGETMTGRMTAIGTCGWFGAGEDLGGWVPTAAPGEATWTLSAVTLGQVVTDGGALKPVRMEQCSEAAAHGESTRLPTFRVAEFVQGVGVTYQDSSKHHTTSSHGGASENSKGNKGGNAGDAVEAEEDPVWIPSRRRGRGRRSLGRLMMTQPTMTTTTSSASVTPASNFTAGSTLVVVGYFNTSQRLVAMFRGYTCQTIAINVTIPTIRTAHIHVPEDYSCGATASGDKAGWVDVSLFFAASQTRVPVLSAFEGRGRAWYEPRAAKPSPSLSPSPVPSASPSASPAASPSASPTASPSGSASPGASPSAQPKNSGKSATKVGVIAGGVAGGLAVLGAGVFFFWGKGKGKASHGGDAALLGDTV